MPKPAPLSTNQAKQTLLNRFGVRADRLRQIATRLGARPYRVFLVYTKSHGDEVGPVQHEVSRTEILPTPRVRTLIYRTLISGGVVPSGSVELSEVSTSFTYEQLIGRVVPVRDELSVPAPYEFHYEVVEDGRGGDVPTPTLYRPLGDPTRDPTHLQWVLSLAPVSQEDV